MTRFTVVLLGLTLLLAPIFAAVPEDQVWSSALASVALLAAALAAFAYREADLPTDARRPLQIFGCVAAWAAVSVVIAAATANPHTAFLDPMLRALCILLAYFGLFGTGAIIAYKQRMAAYALIGAAVAGGGISAVIGLQEFILHAAAGQAGWRIFGTSSPDYLAAYMLLMFPVSLAFAVTARERMLKGLLLLVSFLQLATIFPTQSRFALISLVVEAAVVGAYWLVSRRQGSASKRLSPATIGAAVAIVAVVGILGRPVIQRLTHNQANSGAFRVLTWRGSVRLAKAHPITGTGLGTWQYAYQRYAEAGFTRVAHNSYLQLLDDSGAPGLILLLTLLGVGGATAWRGVVKETEDDDEQVEENRRADAAKPIIAPTDRLMILGILAGAAAETVQNLIDSDWYVFAIGATTAALAGIMTGFSASRIADPDAEPATRKPLGVPAAIAWGVASLAATIYAGTAALGSYHGTAAAAASGSSGDAGAADSEYRSAIGLAPLNGKLLGEYGYRVQFASQHDADGAVKSLQAAIALLPDSVNYMRLGRIYAATNQIPLAIEAYKRGLQAEPNSVDLLIELAAISSREDALKTYQRLAGLEQSSVGQVRAIGDITEARFAIADAAVADDALARHDDATALVYYNRAHKILEQYATEGGSTNEQHEAMSGGHPDPRGDGQYAALYTQISDKMKPLLPPDKRDGADVSATLTEARFAIIVGDAQRGTGDSQDATASYAAASGLLAKAQAASQQLPLDIQGHYTKTLESLSSDLTKRTATAGTGG